MNLFEENENIIIFTIINDKENLEDFLLNENI